MLHSIQCIYSVQCIFNSMPHSIQCPIQFNAYSIQCFIQFNAYSIQCSIQFNAYSIQCFIQFNAYSIQCFIQFSAPFDSMVDQVSLSRTNLRESGNENVKDVGRHIEIGKYCVACSRRSDSGVRAKRKQAKERVKNEGRLGKRTTERL